MNFRLILGKTGFAIATLFLLVCITPSAYAGGVEFPAAGTNALGRGGAVHARPGNAMALLYNPANLAAESGMQLSLQTHLTFYKACLDRTGTYRNYADRNNTDVTDNEFRSLPDSESDESAFGQLSDPAVGDRAFPEVCNSGPPGVIPELIFTWRVHKRVGIGLGLVAPAGVGHTVWGEDQRVGDRTYRGIVDGLPAPTRYSLIEEQLIIAFPTLGVGVSVHPRVRLGLAFGSGFGILKFTNITRAIRGEDFAGDLYTELDMKDRFIPRITASVHVVPIDELDISANLYLDRRCFRQWRSKTHVWILSRGISGKSRCARHATCGSSTMANRGGSSLCRSHCTSPGRSRKRISDLSGRVEDPMVNERWDIEFDFVYEHNSKVDEFVVTLPTCDPSAGSLHGKRRLGHRSRSFFRRADPSNHHTSS